MPITEKQRELRRKHLGSSDMAALFGLDPRRTAYDVWLDKTGQLVDDSGADGDAADAGNLFEDGVLTWAARQLGPLTRNQYRSRPDLHLASHIDAIVDQTQQTVEGKTGGLFGPLYEPWGEPGTDGIPNRVIIQCQVHMLCAGLLSMAPQVCHVPTFLGGRGFGMFHVTQDLNLCVLIGDKAVEFWEKYVEPVTPPPGVLPMLDTIKRIIRAPKKTTFVGPLILQKYLAVKVVGESAKRLVETAKRELLTALGDAECGDGGAAGTCTYYKQTRRGVALAALRAEQAKIAAKYETITEHRVLRTQTPKT